MTQTECGRWSIHWANRCEHPGCPWRNVLIDNDRDALGTGFYRVDHWDRDTWAMFRGMSDRARELTVQGFEWVDRAGETVAPSMWWVRA